MKHRSITRILALLLCAILLGGSVPAPAARAEEPEPVSVAAEEPAEQTVQTESEKPAEPQASGAPSRSR